jgi:hypothetical protein
VRSKETYCLKNNFVWERSRALCARDREDILFYQKGPHFKYTWYCNISSRIITLMKKAVWNRLIKVNIKKVLHKTK